MDHFWVFGYGSLMWRPGFAYLVSEPARLHGYHRSLCVYSHVHRGTPEEPGLVLGLDRGGSCHGMAFQVAAADWPATIDYLRAREQATSVYLEREKTVRLLRSGRAVQAVTFLVDRAHRQYAGVLEDDELERLVRRGQGVSGHCIDYVMNTLSHLREMKIHDPALERLALRLGLQAARSNSS
jgi:cation transport protein ChaC